MGRTKWQKSVLLITIFVQLSATVALAGCQVFGENRSSELEAMMYNWLEDPPCRPPCWERIIPGQTTQQEALTILRQHPLVTGLEIYDAVIPALADEGEANWRWRGATSGGGSVAYHIDSTVYRISVGNPSKLLTFQDIITAYGEPSHVSAAAVPSTDGNDTVYRLDFVYLSQGFALRWRGSGNNSQKPWYGSGWKDFGLYFFEPTPEGFSLAWGNPKAAEDLVPWRGMLSFDDYCIGSRCD